MEKTSDLFLRNFFDLENDLLCSTDDYKKIDFTSGPWEQTLGLTKNELNQTGLLGRVHPDDLQKTLKAFEIVQTEKKLFKFDNRLVAKDLSVRSFEWRLLKDGLLYARDITQEKDLTRNKNEELILKQTIEELDKIQLSINQHCLVARLNPFGFIMDVNNLFEKSAEFRFAEFIGRPLTDFFDVFSKPDQFEKILALLNEGEKWRGEFRLKTKNGGTFWVDMSMTPIMDQTRHALHEIVCIGYDITEKKLNDERYQTVIRGINAGIWDWQDVTKSEIYWSPKFYELLDYLPNSIAATAENFTGSIHPDDLPNIMPKYEQAMKNGTDYIQEYRILCGNGQYKWIQSMAVILRNEAGQPYRLIGSISDIHQKKLIEFNLQEEKQKTIQSSKLATLGEMAAGLAHEVNNPLTIIFGFIRILEEELISHEMNYEIMLKHVGLIKNAAERAAKIVSNLKDFARDGSSDPFTDVPASQLIATVLDLCKERFKKNGIRMDLEVVRDPNIYCRKIELSQVLLNLIFNAFDAVEEKTEKWVKITAQEYPLYLELSVIDSGHGLPASVTEKLFRPFFTTKKVGFGTGIGLSISQRIILNHGGEIFYDSTSPHTRFVVRLPLHESL